MSTSTRTQVHYCINHHGERGIFYCKTCGGYICGHCILKVDGVYWCKCCYVNTLNAEKNGTSGHPHSKGDNRTHSTSGKLSPMKTCPGCKSTDLYRVHRTGWMRLLPRSRRVHCVRCNRFWLFIPLPIRMRIAIPVRYGF